MSADAKEQAELAMDEALDTVKARLSRIRTGKGPERRPGGLS